MPGCNCPGQSCGCAFQAGAGLSVRGTGSTNNPFIVELDASAASVDQAATGGLDLSAYIGNSIITVDLRQSVTGITLPSSPGARVELVLLQSVGGKTVTSWPSIRTDLKNAGAHVVDQEVAEDGNLITSRNPDDIPAFSKALIERLGAEVKEPEAA